MFDLTKYAVKLTAGASKNDFHALREFANALESNFDVVIASDAAVYPWCFFDYINSDFREGHSAYVNDHGELVFGYCGHARTEIPISEAGTLIFLLTRTSCLLR